MKPLTKECIELIERLKESIKYAEENDTNMTDRSWGMEEGVLISVNDAKEIVSLSANQSPLTDEELEKEAEELYSMPNSEVDLYIGLVAVQRAAHIKARKMGSSAWVSVEDRLPEVGQIVDIWRMPMTQHLQRALSLKGTEYANQYYHETDYIGWRSCNYKFSIEQDDKGDVHCFTHINERYFNTDNSTGYKICIENGEVTYWQPLPSPPKTDKQ